MAGEALKCLFLFLLFLLSICSSGGLAGGFAPMEELSPKKIKWKEKKLQLRTFKYNEINPSTTIFPTTPMFPQTPESSTPTIVAVPTTNPVTVVPTSPLSTPVTVPSTTPVTVAGTPIAVPGAQPITNPVTTYPTTPVTNPVSSPTVASPAISGQSWCVAKTGTSQTLLQTALDYACGIGGCDCSQIQQGGSCFLPNSLENHASFAFNSYFQRNPIATSCDFGGTAMIVNTNPSTGSCNYPLLSSSPSQSSSPSFPATTNPVPTPTPTTVFPTQSPLTTTPSFGSGTPPTPMILNTSNPVSGTGTTTTTGFGSGSPAASSPSSASTCGGFGLFVVIAVWVTEFV